MQRLDGDNNQVGDAEYHPRREGAACFLFGMCWALGTNEVHALVQKMNRLRA